MGAAPDGGWGWVIVLCSALSHMLTVGGFLSLSVMYVHWLEEFTAGRSTTSWVISVALAITYGIGPIPALLASKIGYRPVVVVGGFLVGLGYMLAYFATNVYHLILTIGIISGSGSGFCFLPATVTVAMYFDKRRSLAIGLGTAGVGIGSFVCAPVVHWLIECYGWRGALLVGGAIQLNLCVMGLLLRPLPPRPDSCAFECDVKEVLLDGEEISCNKQPDPSGGAHVDLMEIKRELLSPMGKNSKNNMGGSARHLTVANNSSSTNIFYSANELRYKPRNSIQSGDSKVTTRSKHSMNREILMCGSINSLFLVEKGLIRYDSNRNSLYSNKYSNYSHTSINNKHLKHENAVNASSEKLGKDGLRSLQARNGHSNLQNNTENHECKEVSVEQQSLSGESRKSGKIDWQTILRNPVFVTFLVSNGLTNLSFLMPVLFMVDRAKDNGIAIASATLLVSINGAGNVFGRIFFGYFTERCFSDRLVPYIMCLSLCGAATSLSSLCGGVLWLHGVYALTFGFCI
ncbi:hypothetical protein EGW08_004984, partial [Elysia chlorotica]